MSQHIVYAIVSGPGGLDIVTFPCSFEEAAEGRYYGDQYIAPYNLYSTREEADSALLDAMEGFDPDT